MNMDEKVLKNVDVNKRELYFVFWVIIFFIVESKGEIVSEFFVSVEVLLFGENSCWCFCWFNIIWLIWNN